MENINTNIIMQAGAAVANAANKAAGISAATPEPGSIISVIQLVNGGRTIGPDALAHFTESVRNKLLSLLVSMEPIQSGSGTPSPDNVRPISGRTRLNVYVSPTSNIADATTHAVDWTTPAGTVYGGTLDVVSGVLTVDMAMVDMGTLTWTYRGNGVFTSVDVAGYNKRNSDICYCSAYKGVSARAYQDLVDKSVQCGNSFHMNNAINVKDTAYSDAAIFKTAVSGVQLVYELATPLTYQLTRQNIITLVGDNYIWSDSGDVTITE